MKSRRAHSFLLVFGFLTGLALPLATGTATSPSPAPHDAVFDEIELTAEGVTAVDTLGNRWRYDFTTDQFVPDEETRRPSGSGQEGRPREANIAPVEERCTEEQTVKPFERTVLIGYDEFVGEDVIAVGRVTVKGWVKGDVQSINGRVLVTESGQVDGDIKAPEIVVRPGGMVLGKQEISSSIIDFPTSKFGEQFSVDGLIIVVSLAAFILLVGFIALSLAPKQCGNLSHCLRQYPIRSTFVGLAMVFLLPLLVLVLAITIVGILLVPFLPLAMVVAAAMGVLALGGAIGQRLLRKYRTEGKPGMVEALGGAVVFMLLWLVVAILLGSGDEVSQGFGIFFLVVSILITLHPVLGGIGAAVLTRFGGRQYASFRDRHQTHEAGVPSPAPPPIPSVPPLATPPPPFGRPGPDVPPPLSSSDSQ